MVWSGKMNEAGDGKESGELVESLYELYTRFGEPDGISFLDGRLSLGWRPAATGLDRHEKISVDAKLLYYLSWPAWNSCQIHFDIDGHELVVKSSGGEVWSRIDDVAGSGEGP